MQRTLGMLIIALAAIFVLSTLLAAQTLPSGGGVTGTIVARLGGNPVALPDIQVTLVNRDTRATTAPITTDLNGRFGFPLQPPGTYQLCWQAAGWQADCLETPIIVADNTVRLGLVTIEPETTLGLVYGGVTLADGTACQFSSPLFGINLTAHVSAVNGEGRMVAGPVRANIGGQYVLPGLPQTAGRVRATCDRATVESPVGSSGPGTDTRIDLFLHNFRPQVRGFLPTLGGRPVRQVPPGATVKVEAAASDQDGDTLSLSWKAAEGSGVVRTRSDGTAVWALPREPGLHTLYVLASDGKGGIRQGRLALNTGTDGVFFSGIVTGPDSRAIAGASVNVNDTMVTTDANGVFSVTVTQSDNFRYTVTVTRTGYVPQSRIFDNGAGATSWHLLPAQVTAVDPHNNIDIRDGDGRGTARLQIAANSLVDEDGAPPSGLVNIALATLDPDTAPLPGDDGGIDDERQRVLIGQFGGVYIDISDAAGHHYQLRPGVSAEVSIPIAPSRLRAETPPPAEIAMWEYDGVTGNWRPHGIAERQGTIWDTLLDGSMSSAVAGAGVAQLAQGCLLVYGQVNQRSIGVAVRVTPVGGPPLPPFPITGQYNLMAPLPANSPVTLELLNDLGDDVPDVQFFNVPSMGALPNNLAQSGTITGPPIAFPSDCSAQVTFTLSIPPWQGSPGSQLLEFNLPTGSDSFAQSYYSAVDPQNKRTTLGDWWAQNGFNASGVASGDTLATYLNTNELGVGSYVRCSQSSNHSTTGCYMTIYGNPDADPGNADLAYHAVKSNASVTLAMEAAVTNPPSVPMVKYFAYAGPNGSSMRVNSVDLDGYGPKYVPSVCVTCHGGGYFSVNNNMFNINDPSSSPELYASLREFDRSTLMSPSGHDMSAALDKLNSIVRQGNPVYNNGNAHSGSAIAQLIDGWYQSGTFNPAFVPPGWSDTASDQAFYLNAVATSCRTCHDAFDNGINWTTKANFIADPEQQGVICPNGGRVMPNAVMTYINFWLNDRQNLFQNLFLWPTGCPTGQ